MSIAQDKADARKAAFARRASAERSVTVAANRHLVEAVRQSLGHRVSAYWPMRTEIDPRPGMEELSDTHDLCLPVVLGPALPLTFRQWAPGEELIDGGFGTFIPEAPEEVVPDILIVPLAAFDSAGYRLGYGGGFYDRTLEKLRKAGPITSIGFAYDVQECTVVPRDSTDQKLDLIVTESGVRRPV